MTVTEALLRCCRHRKGQQLSIMLHTSTAGSKHCQYIQQSDTYQHPPIHLARKVHQTTKAVTLTPYQCTATNDVHPQIRQRKHVHWRMITSAGGNACVQGDGCCAVRHGIQQTCELSPLQRETCAHCAANSKHANQKSECWQHNADQAHYVQGKGDAVK